jgi:hypothetical protein
VLVDSVRGHASQFKIADGQWREGYADDLLREGASALVIDPISPLMAMHGVDSNDNDMSRMVLEQLGEIAVRANLNHLFIVDHTGHADKTRGRGASAKEDWADVLWNITAPDDSPYRSLAATGRGVSGAQRYLMRDKRLHLAAAKDAAQGSAGGTVSREGLIMAELRKGARTSVELAPIAGVTPERVRQLLKELEAVGNVQQRGKRGHAEQWQLPY